MAPCRVDCGGTLDIGPLALGLNPLRPATFNLALEIPTRALAEPNPGNGRAVISRGFEEARVKGPADYTQPLGFFLLAMDYFGLNDVKLTLDSESPPRSALGGSSVAILTACAALSRLAGKKLRRVELAELAYQLESALFSTPCGRQDHLAAAYGGAHLWTWTPAYKRGYRKRKLVQGSKLNQLERRILIAYPGQTHSSAEVNRTWTQGFLTGEKRLIWEEINKLTRRLGEALEAGQWASAAENLIAETELRLALTPEVLTETGLALFSAAKEAGVGARFTGAGGGGCLWAIGPKKGIEALKPRWAEILATCPKGRLLPSKLNRTGLKITAKLAD